MTDRQLKSAFSHNEPAAVASASLGRCPAAGSERSAAEFEPGAPIIKICGLNAPAEAELAARLGADLCGFIFHPPSLRAVSPAQAAKMPTPGAVRVGVFVRQCLSEILEIIDQARLDMVQLHGEQSPVLAAEIGPERIIRVFWPEKAAVPGAESLDDLFNRWLHLAKWFLFDAGLAAGGHGRRLAVKFKCPKPYFLAGGLTGTDVVSGWPPADPNLVGFDLNSSLESSPGRKDPAAIRAMMASLGTIKTLPQSL